MPNRDALTIDYASGDKITLWIDNSQGKLFPAGTSVKKYGSDLGAYLKATGFGLNWFIAEKTVYQKMKKQTDL